MPEHAKSQCPRCGTEFECKQGSITLCHCFNVQLSSELQQLISAKWDGCLCHRCLNELSNVNVETAKSR